MRYNENLHIDYAQWLQQNFEALVKEQNEKGSFSKDKQSTSITPETPCQYNRLPGRSSGQRTEADVQRVNRQSYKEHKLSASTRADDEDDSLSCEIDAKHDSSAPSRRHQRHWEDQEAERRAQARQAQKEAEERLSKFVRIRNTVERFKDRFKDDDEDSYETA